MRWGPVQRLMLSIAACAVAVSIAPAAASAATYTVDTTAVTADAAINGVCDDGSGQCTLTAAVQESNTSTAVDDLINFDGAVFTGNPATSRIQPGAAGVIPAISDSVVIDGGQCSGSADAEPCTEIRGTGTSSFDALTLSSGAGGSLISHLAFNNLASGVKVQAGLVATIRGNWFGVDTDESPTANGVGVILSGSGGTVGGSTPANRNWFARNGTGIHILGGDSNAVEGNFFGTTRAGGSAASATYSNADSILVNSNNPDTAAGNAIGASDPLGVPNTDCDGPCNLFGNASDDHIDLGGTTSASIIAATGTAIRGNFIGVGLTGTDINAAGISSGRAGVDFGAPTPATSTTVGGPGVAARNFIGGNNEGIQTNQVTDITSSIRNNWIGMQPDGTGFVPNEIQGILVSGSPSGSVSVIDNRVAGGIFATSAAIYAYGRSTVLRSNILGVDAAGTVRVDPGSGIQTQASTVNLDIGGTTIGQGNVIGGFAVAGIRLNGAFGTNVRNNGIGTDLAGTADFGNSGPGILVEGTAGTSTSSVIGGSTAASENVISNNGGDAIRVDRVHGVDIQRNRGSGNDEQFIDLMNPAGTGNNLADGAAQGLQAPVITSFNSTTLVAGTSEPNATVQVFAKASAAAGELGTYLLTVTATGAGTWSATIPAQAEGQRIVALQTVDSTITPFGPQSSELSAVVQIDSVPPATPAITDIDPDSPGSTNTPAVKGTAEAGSTVRLYSDATCTGTVLATGTAAAFASPGLTPSTPIPSDATTNFRVRATDAAGNPSACSAPFPYVEDSTGPTTNITSAPSGTTADNTPTVSFTASEAGSSACSVDGGAFTACTSPATFGPLSDGAHTVEVRSTDASGNQGATVSASFTVDTAPPATTITSAPSGTTSDNTPTIGFSSSEAGTSSCSVDGGAFASCTSPANFGPLPDGAHTIAVRSTDAVGNQGAPATASFTVDTKVPVTTKKCKKGQKLKKGKCVKKKKRKKK